ncbi:Major facilitator superfamily domain [Phytophthora cactorum]|nr:Major facilitator superfamily domain [Phytophthora cactorum]
MQSQDQYVGLASPSLHADDAGVHQRRTTFPIRTDPLQDDKASEIKLLSVARPHMRAFHYAWLSFFFAFFGWFSIPPLMPTIKKQLGLTADQVSNSNIVSVASTILGRAVGGPMCDRYGSRTVQAVLLVVGSIPVASASFVTSYTGLMFARFFIGFVGCSFIATTYWTSTMFTKEVVGSANALAAGWGNLGAGATTLITPSYSTLSQRVGLCPTTWAGALLSSSRPSSWSSLVSLSTLIPMTHGSGETCNRYETGSPACRQDAGHLDPGFPHACSFGVELQVHNVLTEYYYEDFTYPNCDPATDANECRRLTQSRATLISSLFGLMCIFARALGGYLSDVANRRCGMKGRVGVQFVAFAGQAVFLYLYSTTRDLSTSIPLLVFFGIFVQACTGSTYGIVPYVLPASTGATSGFVGAGGNVGALCWSLMFKGIGNRGTSFKYLSIFVAAAALTTFGIKVPGNAALWEKDDSVHGGLAPTEVDDDSVHNGKQTV